MKNKTLPLLLLGLLIFSACQKKKPSQDGTIAISFKHGETIDIGQFIEKAKYIQLENHPESAFTDIDRMLVYEGNLLMLDKRLEALFCFDTTGKFRFRIQKVGRGPGEYQELESFWINPSTNEIWLQSYWPPKAMVYDLDGVLIREFNIRWAGTDMIRLSSGLLTGYNASRSEDEIGQLGEGLFLLDETGRYKGQNLLVGDSSIYWSVSNQRNLEDYEGGALLLSQSDTLYRVYPDGRVEPDLFMDFGALRYPDELRGITFNSPRYPEAIPGKYVYGKDHLIAFGPIRIFRIFVNGQLEIALADLKTGKGEFSNQIRSENAPVPLLYPIGKSDRNELVGFYDMSVLLAMKESRTSRRSAQVPAGIFEAMDSLVDSAILEDRPVVWMAKIKEEYLKF